MSAQLIFEPMRPTARKSVPGRTGCTGLETRVEPMQPSTPVRVPTLPDPWSPPPGAGDPATDIPGPPPFMALPFSPAGAHGAVRSAGAFGGILVTVVLALGVLRLAGTESVSVTYWGSAFARPADQRGDAVATAEFTGQFDNGVPVYRLPAIQIADVRAKR